LSSAILDRYLDTLDGNRMYFTAADIASFNRLRYELDDRTRTGDLQPVSRRRRDRPARDRTRLHDRRDLRLGSQ
jgi:hypothetical protein